MSYLLPFIFSFILTLIITYLLINFQKKRKIGQMVREEGPVMHYKKKGTPTLGGISFLIVLILTYI
ncbi:MAG TPA: phospho-N-acetylmuramoyl-pentapeptide-transferase, partial [Caldisericia bacterium]|nr:phospho-N-acetylmuramoyl-pentapeptide-transferase [Caldisericia bacterium]